MIQETEFNSLQEYLDIVSGIPSNWKINPSGIWYRGVNESNYSLVPGCVWRGIDLELEESYVLEFLVHYRSFYEKTHKNPLELYALMQHYGLPTRLLDWSASPLVGLYFALEQESQSQNTVWALSPTDLNQISIGMEFNIVPKENINDCFSKPWLPGSLRDGLTDEVPAKAFAFKHALVNPRISAQKGCFTFHGKSRNGIDKYFENNATNGLYKLKLSRRTGAREEILQQLYALGYKEDDIYKDLSSLTKRIIREHSILLDA